MTKPIVPIYTEEQLCIAADRVSALMWFLFGECVHSFFNKKLMHSGCWPEKTDAGDRSGDCVVFEDLRYGLGTYVSERSKTPVTCYVNHFPRTGHTLVNRLQTRKPARPALMDPEFTSWALFDLPHHIPGNSSTDHKMFLGMSDTSCEVSGITYGRVSDLETTFAGIGIGLFLTGETNRMHHSCTLVKLRHLDGSKFLFTIPLLSNSNGENISS